MNIDHIMNKELIMLSMDDTLAKAKDIFEHNNIHHLLIIDDDGVLAGVITDRDLYMHLSPTVGTSQESHRDTALIQKKLHQIMVRDIITTQGHYPISKAILLFHDNHISSLPIVDEENHPIGIITWRDIVKILAIQYRRKK